MIVASSWTTAPSTVGLKPPPTKLRVTNIFVEPATNHLTVEYEDVPEEN